MLEKYAEYAVIAVGIRKGKDGDSNVFQDVRRMCCVFRQP